MLMQLLRRFLRPYRSDLGIVVLLQLVATAASLYLPSMNAEIIDRGVVQGDTGYILSTGGLMLLVAALQIACAVSAVYFGARTAMAHGRDLRAAIFHRVAEFSSRELGRFGAPSLITRTTNDVQQVTTLVLMCCTMVVTAPIICVGGIVMALREDVALSKLLLVSVPVLSGAVGTIIFRMIPQFRRMQPKIDALNRIVREQITGIRVVRAFVREPDEARRFDVANVDLTETALRVGRLQAMMLPIVLIVFNASSVSVIWFGSHRIASGALDVGAMIAFLSYLMQILMAVMMVTFTSVMIPRAAVCAERIMAVLKTEPSINSDAAPAPALRAPSAVVELSNVEYKYPGAELAVLHAITLRAEPGKTTAIIGSTGAGKTTLLDLIARLVDPTSGTVAIDGIDNRARALETLWARVGLVPQRPYLFTGTVASNLRYGDPNATDAELWAALDVAQAGEFVSAMPLQLEAPIAQGGTNVSGGQRQRLSIARALLRKPAVYLFDDAFSALDLTTESRLRAALRPHTRNATLIMVAQRVASIIEAEQIIVIDAGAIVGTGTHAQLLRSCATYREIVESQRNMGAAA